MSSTIHRTIARRWTRLAQILVLVLLVGAVAVAGAGMPFLTEPVPLDLDAIRAIAAQQQTSAGTTTDDAASKPEFDVQFVATQLAMVHNAPKPDETKPSSTDGQLDLNDPALTDEVGTVTFLGSILSPTRRVAVLRVDGRQLLIAQGQERMGIEVEEVGDGFVRITRDGEPLRIERSARKPGQLTMTANPGVDQPTPIITPGSRRFQNRPNATRGSIDGVDPEVIAERQAQRRAELLKQSDARRLDRARRRGEIN